MVPRSVRFRRALAATLVLLVALFVASATPDGLSAQATAEAGAREMRHFWHVFVAYAAAWILILGWVWSIVRCLRRVEDKLN